MGERFFLEKLSVLSFSGPQSTLKVKSKHPVALNEKKKNRHLNLALVINYIFTSIRTKCTFHRIGQYNKRFYFVSPNLQNLQHGVPETAILFRSKRVDQPQNLNIQKYVRQTHRQTLTKDLIKSLYHTTNNNWEKGKKQGNR